MKKVFKVALKLAQLNVPGKIEKARFMVESMTSNEVFPNPVPALAEITAAADDLEKAYLASRNASTDATADMHEKEIILERRLTILAQHVESVANLNPEKGDSIILSSGIDMKAEGIKHNQGFRGESTEHPGEVLLRTHGIKRASYIWEFALSDDAAPQWKEASTTLQASVYVKGLISNRRYLFRVAVVTREGQGPWSDPVNVLVA